MREIREWKDRLYAHRMKRKDTSDYDSEEDDRRPMNSRWLRSSSLPKLTIVDQFAPPPMSFAPPKAYDEDNRRPPPPPPSDIPTNPTGDDAYARRMRMSQQQNPSLPPPSNQSPPPPPPSSEPAIPSGQISRAAVRYNLPPPPPEIPASEAELAATLASDSPGPSTPTTEDDGEEAPRSKRPGQAGFAERLLSKYGWTKGTGLGATGTGIVNPLYAKLDKRKKKSDAEGGGFVTPAGQGKILGGQKDKNLPAGLEEGKFGKMSEVIKLRGMLRGLDLDEELNRSDGGNIMQEIGEECSEKYGTVERVYIHRHSDEGAAPEDPEGEGEEGPQVFIKFTSQLSALRAVNALEGRMFGGNVIGARFWETEMFERGVYR